MYVYSAIYALSANCAKAVYIDYNQVTEPKLRTQTKSENDVTSRASLQTQARPQLPAKTEFAVQRAIRDNAAMNPGKKSTVSLYKDCL